MKAIVQDVYGSADVLRLEEIGKPMLTEGEVLIRVRAAGVDPGVWHLMTGRPYLVRAMGFGLRAPKVRVRGRDVAGTVEGVGSKVTRFKPGDEVFGTAEGSFAEYVCAREDKLAAKPANMTFEQAAVTPISGLTALQGIRDVGKVQPGQKVLIIGAAGGVGTFAVQIARSFGTEVTAVCSTRHVELVRSIGAQRVIDYTRDDFTLGGERYDLMLDVAGNRSWSECVRVLESDATYVGVGAAGIQHGKGGGWRAIGRFLQVRMGSLRSTRRVVTLFIAKLSKDDLVFLGALLASGKLTAVIDRRYDLAGVADALGYLDQGHAMGKIAIEIA